MSILNPLPAMEKWSQTLNSKMLTLLILLPMLVTGQSVKKDNVKDTSSQLELGVDLLWLINKNQIPAATVFGRFNYVRNQHSKRAWRFRLGVDNRTYDSAQINDPRNNEMDIIAPYLRVGYEFQKDINKKASYFYGIDVSAFYSVYKAKMVIYPGPNLVQITDKTFETGLMPFLGFKYKPTEWLAISMESSVGFMYRIRREKDKVTDIDFPNSSGCRGKIDLNEFKIKFLPITVINMSFYLNRKYDR
jgi:hypothetical protein